MIDKSAKVLKRDPDSRKRYEKELAKWDSKIDKLATELVDLQFEEKTQLRELAASYPKRVSVLSEEYRRERDQIKAKFKERKKEIEKELGLLEKFKLAAQEQ